MPRSWLTQRRPGARTESEAGLLVLAEVRGQADHGQRERGSRGQLWDKSAFVCPLPYIMLPFPAGMAHGQSLASANFPMIPPR
jgi:hypothetical protein